MNGLRNGRSSDHPALILFPLGGPHVCVQAFVVGRSISFFDLGGHSLLLIELQVALEAAFNRIVPMPELLRDPTVAGVAAAVEQSITTPLHDSVELPAYEEGYEQWKKAQGGLFTVTVRECLDLAEIGLNR